MIWITNLGLIFGILVTFYILYVVVDKFLIPTMYILKDKMKLTDDQAGALISFVSSAPELSVSMISLYLAIQLNDPAKFNEIASLGPGTVIGSALFSVLFIVGVSSWFSNKALTWHTVTRDMVYYIFSVAVMYFILSDSTVYWWEAFVLLGLYGVYALIVSKWPQISKLIGVKGTKLIEKQVNAQKEKMLHIRDISWSLNKAIPKIFSFLFFPLKSGFKVLPVSYNIFTSILLVIISSYYMVDFSQLLAKNWNIPSTIIALTILAAGTSVPDLLASIKTSREGYGDTAITNAVGSNVFDLLGNLGLTWVIAAIFTGFKPVGVDVSTLNGLIALLLASSLALVFLLVAKKFNLSKVASFSLMTAYILFVVFTCLQALKII
jgi:Ca2+/Na+ antiporter